ncbi:hypothetical protein WN55_07599 [Dufourea novaeangliae]|uniref:Uncharacterized protein n=1 Tax=Dufourea novaeangliae TaxID=178035 RepID=A0A154P2Q5_DUFNO|nr:hypothetical protein WN55_07599 [Dufourea novaeangliae]
MSSRLRGSSSIKDGSKVTSYSKEHLHDDREDLSMKSYKNGTNRYHFGMVRQQQNDEVRRNGRDNREHFDDDADVLYKKSRDHFGAWDMKDIVQDERLGSRKQPDRFEDSRLTNGRSKNDAGRQDRYDDHGTALLSRDDRGKTGYIDQEQSQKSKKKDSWDGSDTKVSSKLHRSRNNQGKDDPPKIDERDLLLREIENLAVDGRSPDRRIRAMIERFKSREEEKLKSRKDRESLSPEKEEYRSKSANRGDTRIDHENSVNDRGSRIQKDDREDERRTEKSKIRDLDRNEHEENGRNRSVDRRDEKFNDSILDKNEDSRRNDSFRPKNDTYGSDKSHRRSREVEDDPPRRKDSPKRKSYAYEGNPENFDVRIQRYERTLLEPRRDLDSPKRVPLKDADADLGRKESFKDHDRRVTRKSSFKSDDAKKSRESSLNRKTSFKNQENDLYRNNSFKSPDTEKKYFGKDTEHVSRKSSFKEPGYEAGKKNSFKEQNSDYGRISSKNRDDDEERKNSFKGHTAGVSRITFKKPDGESTRIHSYKDQDPEVGRVNFRHHSNDVGRKNSFKEKTVEFGGISYKNHDDDGDTDRRTTYKNQDNEPSKGSYRSLDDSRRKPSPNGRYVEFGTVSYHTHEDETPASPPNDHDLERKSSFKETDSSAKRRVSPRSKSHDSFDRRSDRHSRPLTPPKRNESELYREDSKDREDFDAKCWHESNRVFAVKYLRENSKHRSNPEGHSEIERDPSPETMGLEYREKNHSSEGFGEEIESAKQRNEYSSNANSYSLGDTEQSQDPVDSRYSSTRERNGATIIRIRTNPETPIERRRRRRPVQELQVGRRRRYDAGDEEDTEDEDEDEDEDGHHHHRQRSSRADGCFTSPRGGVHPTPSRRVWNYREGVWHFHESIAFDQSFMVQKREAIFINRWRR